MHAKRSLQENQISQELENERNLLRASSHLKKKEKIPKIDTNENPFCETRRLADEFQLQNYNKVKYLITIK